MQIEIPKLDLSFLDRKPKNGEMKIRDQIEYEMIMSIYSGHTTQRSTIRMKEDEMSPQNDNSMVDDNRATMVSAQTKFSSFGSFLE